MNVFDIILVTFSTHLACGVEQLNKHYNSQL